VAQGENLLEVLVCRPLLHKQENLEKLMEIQWQEAKLSHKVGETPMHANQLSDASNGHA
jgi:hypothetical protein